MGFLKAKYIIIRKFSSMKNKIRTVVSEKHFSMKMLMRIILYGKCDRSEDDHIQMTQVWCHKSLLSSAYEYVKNADWCLLLHASTLDIRFNDRRKMVKLSYVCRSKNFSYFFWKTLRRNNLLSTELYWMYITMAQLSSRIRWQSSTCIYWYQDEVIHLNIVQKFD